VGAEEIAGDLDVMAVMTVEENPDAVAVLDAVSRDGCGVVGLDAVAPVVVSRTEAKTTAVFSVSED
jgi:hypothetical protein